ncbi:Por secretion system C-terminal sorting domain-containing protein [Chitinophaga jiangningensis]|uniref:Por secretion system C-terminal sorting domain-containing protein n=1 Tax=Chitinophaga jiangningensis TaxID=1419482 RepID=A0A1M7JA02_9BACT|nr:cellulase family glycosylhydrolase [Chitinophaga jiangningensis]SHM49327.1 Por secretion system C-terminal sorting domain-containing protein [Chitinophaga jiangningensis]
MPRFTLKSLLTTLGARRICTYLQMLILLLTCNFVSAQLPTAATIAGKMKVGWNLGNTLEAICGETVWGGAYTTKTTIDAVKAAGFNTVRLPVAWDCHSNNGVIDAAWMARVKQVVDYCIQDSLYVIINIHWDNGWLENNVTTAAQTQVNAKQQNYWTQIGNYFKNYNDHLLFASANEPAVSDATGMAVLLSYHQTFVNAVRATGGNNSSRTLIVQGPSTNIERTDLIMNTLPTDPIANRLMVEVHYYEPYQFSLMPNDESWGKMFYYWGNGYHSTTDVSRNSTWGEEAYVEDMLGRMKTKYVDKGIPVIIGEFAAIQRTVSAPSDQALHDASRWYFYRYFTQSARAKGIIPYVWDINMQMFNRGNGTVLDQTTISAMMQGAGITPGYIRLSNRATGLLADGMYRNTNGANAGQWAYSGTDAQQWTVESIDGYVKLKNRATGLYLDGMGRTTNGSIAGQWANSSSYNQQWKLEITGSYIKLRNRATGLYLDGLGQTANGADLAQWAVSSSNNQQWTITLATLPATTLAAPATLSTTALTAENSLQVYPNPFNNVFAIQLDKTQKVERIAIIDAAGKTRELKVRPDAADLSALGATLKPGTYVVEAKGRGWTKTCKVIKVK